MPPTKKPASAKRPVSTRAPARHRRQVVTTTDDAEQLKTDPDDDVAQRAVARIEDRVTSSEAVYAEAPGSHEPRRRGKSPQRRTAVDRLDDPPPATGAMLIERVSRAVERELMQIEVIVSGHHVLPRQRTEAERRARTLASLARTLGELMRLRADEQKVKPDDDDVPRDLDEFRRELSRRLEQMVRGREADSAGGNE